MSDMGKVFGMIFKDNIDALQAISKQLAEMQDKVAEEAAFMKRAIDEKVDKLMEAENDEERKKIEEDFLREVGIHRAYRDYEITGNLAKSAGFFKGIVDGLIATMEEDTEDKQEESKETKQEDFNKVNVIYDYKSAKEVLERRKKFNEPMQTVEIGGMGPQYEDACQTLMLRMWKYMDEHPELEEKVKALEEGKDIPLEIYHAFDEIVDDINPSGAQYNAALLHALYIKREGYKKWLEGGPIDRIIMWVPHIKWGGMPE